METIEILIPKNDTSDIKMRIISLACAYESTVKIDIGTEKINAKSILRMPDVKTEKLYSMEIEGNDEAECVKRFQELFASNKR